jgi:hypothetical protein
VTAPLAPIRRRRAQIAFTYLLTLLENLFQLLYPWAVGLAIDGLLGGRGWPSLLQFVVIWTLHIVVGIGRHLYDTRLFARIYAELATATVLRQRAAGSSTAEVAARAAMGRELVTFFERELPAIATVTVGIVGGIAMTAFYDLAAGLVLAAALVPLLAMNRVHGRRAQRLNRGLNDQTEREVGVIDRADRRRVAAHFLALARWRIRLSNAEAVAWTVAELVAMAATILLLLRVTSLPDVQAGEIFAVLAYVWRVLECLDQVPLIVQQAGRLLDIRRRVELGAGLPVEVPRS